MIDDLVETWRINNRVTLQLLEHLSEGALRCTLSTRGGRTVGQQLAHLLEVRRSRLERADRQLAAGVPAVTREHGHDPDRLREGFERSGDAIAEVIRASAEAGGQVKGFRRGVVVLVGYLIAHEAHHRGHALLTLKQAGGAFPSRQRMALWDWNRI